jgi:hypothetical protein
MRKLTVKNFSVIKEAELEFGKITVLIGPQSSGKSLLCKLAYFLSREAIQIAEDLIAQDFQFSAVAESVRKQFESWFPSGGWGDDEWSVSLYSDNYSVTVSAEAKEPGKPHEINVAFGSEFIAAYDDLLKNSESRFPHAALRFRELIGNGVWDRATYIPSERSYFADAQSGYRVMANYTDPLSKGFALLYANSLNPEIPKPKIRQLMEGEVVRGEDLWKFAFGDGRTLPISHISSGGKELLPLLSVLGMYEYQRPSTMKSIQNGFGLSNWYKYDDFFIEEPEASIFPKTQYELVCYFAEFVNSELFESHFTITTHSPYVISSLNNLLEAWQSGHMDDQRGKAVREVIDQKYWLNPDAFRAYSINDGYLKSIMDEDTHLISDNFLDSVSERIGGEFDELLRIGYVEA